MVEYNRSVGVSIEDCYITHKDLIYRIANQNTGVLKNTTAMSYEDLLQIAIIGFIQAYKDFDARYNTKFSTYAHDIIRWELTEALRKRYIIHFPDSFCRVWTTASKYNLTKNNMDELMKRKPQNMSKESLASAIAWMEFNVPTSLDSTVTTATSSEDKEKELYEKVIGGFMDETVVIVNDFLLTLSEKELAVTELLLAGKKQPEIAKELGISQPQTSRIIKNIRKLWTEYAEEVDA